MKISVAQINPTVGDIDGNLAKIITYYEQAGDSDLIVFGELSLIGYSPEDLVLRPGFQKYVMNSVTRLAEVTKGKKTAMLIGSIWKEKDQLYNVALLIENGEVRHIFRKHALPNYGVFDEVRVYNSGPLPEPIEFKGHKLSILVCEDMWREPVHEHIAKSDSEITIVINASPYEFQKRRMRTISAGKLVRKAGRPLLYVNLVGGQDELVFDGNSFLMDASGEIVWNMPAFEEGLISLDISAHRTFTPFPGGTESIYAALVLGLRDYVNKNGFKGVVLGLSGGIDSAITAAMAVDALGSERVLGVLLPSKYTAEESFTDAYETAKLLGIKTEEISIEETTETINKNLAGMFKGMDPDITEENIQSRTRAVMLMAISNKLGLMLISTGNKSEMSVGYSTLYGDLCGGYCVLKDVYKTTVYKLANYRNKEIPGISVYKHLKAIPDNSITREPTAELRHDQKDSDSLPPYDVLDKLLHRLIEKQMGIYDIIAEGYDEALVKRVAKMLYRAEYKRRQSAPGVKISGMAFGRDRRYPITNGFIN